MIAVTVALHLHIVHGLVVLILGIRLITIHTVGTALVATSLHPQTKLIPNAVHPLLILHVTPPQIFHPKMPFAILLFVMGEIVYVVIMNVVP